MMQKKLLSMATTRSELAAAIDNCDMGFCLEIRQRGLDIFSNPGKTILTTATRWLQLFTVLLIETKVAARVGSTATLDPLTMREAVKKTTFRELRTSPLKINSSELGGIIANAAADGCFAAVPFSDSMFLHVVERIFEFPRKLKSVADQHAMSVEEFFQLADRCQMGSSAFTLLRPMVTHMHHFTIKQASFILPFVRLLSSHHPGIVESYH